MKNLLVKFLFVSITFLVFFLPIHAQNPPKPFGAVPTERQLKWHETEMYCLVHFTPTTFENKEWGYGDANPKVFNPTAFDADQIVKSAKAGGLKGLILVAKHHDGFCLFPTKTTDYNISKSPFRDGKGDMVKEFEQACRKNGLKFGVYCSPWDRNSAAYGTPEYLEIYRSQLKELYGNYGELFMSWHDGANGGDGFYGGANEKRKIDNTVYYKWDETWGEITRKMQPNAAIFSDVGWDVRWVGNEKGFADENSRATFTPKFANGTPGGVPGNANDFESPFGTKNGEKWIPAECDVPLRKGWFYHPEEDNQVKSPAELLDLYFKSVGRGAALDLGLAPDTRGLLHENDVKSLAEFGILLEKIFGNNLTKTAKISASNTRGKAFSTKYLIDNNKQTYWASVDEITNPEIIVSWKKPITFNIVSLREAIQLGQRIDGFTIEIFENNAWKEISRRTTVGALKLVRLGKDYTTQQIRIRITASPVCVTLSEIGVFRE